MQKLKAVQTEFRDVEDYLLMKHLKINGFWRCYLSGKSEKFLKLAQLIWFMLMDFSIPDVLQLTVQYNYIWIPWIFDSIDS